MPNYVQVPDGEIPTTAKCETEGCYSTFTIIGRVGTVTALCLDCWVKREKLLKELIQKETGEML